MWSCADRSVSFGGKEVRQEEKKIRLSRDLHVLILLQKVIKLLEAASVQNYCSTNGLEVRYIYFTGLILSVEKHFFFFFARRTNY